LARVLAGFKDLRRVQNQLAALKWYWLDYFHQIKKIFMRRKDLYLWSVVLY